LGFFSWFFVNNHVVQKLNTNKTTLAHYSSLCCISFFTEKIMVRQERKKHLEASPPPTTRSTHAMEKPFLMEKEQTNPLGMIQNLNNNTYPMFLLNLNSLTIRIHTFSLLQMHRVHG
jgi:hypothetical protein